jgi:glycerol kinase
MANYVLAIDQGTTGSTCLLMKENTLEIVDKEKIDYAQIYPTPGWVEHNLHDIWDSVKNCTLTILKRKNINANDIKGIGITNQRETTCAFKKDGTPLHNAIVWQDRRTHDFCQKNKEIFNSKFKKKTGLPLDPYFSATKMKWLIENVDNVKRALDSKDLLFGTIDTYLLYKLTQGKSHATEASNASRTQLMNLETFNWDSELLSFFNIPIEALPVIQESFSNFGKTLGLDFLPDGIPILSILGDQQSALFGQTCFEPGDIKCTYGTGAFLLLNTGEKITYSNTGLLTTAAFYHNKKKVYALEGSAYIAGAAVQWVRDNLKIIKTSKDVETLAETITNLDEMKNIQFFPFFTGIGTPYWNSTAQAALVGLTRDSGNPHICRAVLEGIALSVNDSMDSFKKDFAHLNDIRVDGGACLNNLLLQIQANFSEKKILRPQNIDTTAYGVALGTLISRGEKSISDLKGLWKLEREFSNEDIPYYSMKKKLWTSNIAKFF